MKKFIKSAWSTIILVLSVLLSFIMIVIDRACRIYRVDAEQASISEMRELTYLKKDLLYRTKVRILLLMIAVVFFYTYKLIKFML